MSTRLPTWPRTTWTTSKTRLRPLARPLRTSSTMRSRSTLRRHPVTPATTSTSTPLATTVGHPGTMGSQSDTRTITQPFQGAILLCTWWDTVALSIRTPFTTQGTTTTTTLSTRSPPTLAQPQVPTTRLHPNIKIRSSAMRQEPPTSEQELVVRL